MNDRAVTGGPARVVSPDRVAGDATPRRPQDTGFVTGRDARRDDPRVAGLTHATQDAAS
jgi:hypothetical protein